MAAWPRGVHGSSSCPRSLMKARGSVCGVLEAIAPRPPAGRDAQVPRPRPRLPW
jgi:hypothetical protein